MQFERPIECNDWTPIENIKCVKYLKDVGLKTYENAINSCQKLDNNSNLISIESSDEQNSLSSLIFEGIGVKENVWINSIDFIHRYFTNWEINYPLNKIDYKCIQMTAESQPEVGKWINKLCRSYAAVVCERRPQFSLRFLYNFIQ